jgi:hypothetical protein
MADERRPVTWSGAPGEPALRKGEILVCPNPRCEFIVAEVRRDLMYGDRLMPEDLLFVGKRYAYGDATICPDCGADWRDPLTTAPTLGKPPAQ